MKLLAILLAATFGASLSAQTPVNCVSPLSLDNVTGLLEQHVPSARVRQYVLKCGVAFQLTAPTEKRIREAGGNDELIAAIRKTVPVPLTKVTFCPAKDISYGVGVAEVSFELNGTAVGQVALNYRKRGAATEVELPAGSYVFGGSFAGPYGRPDIQSGHLSIPSDQRAFFVVQAIGFGDPQEDVRLDFRPVPHCR